MAVWQFKFSLVPTSGVKRVHGDLVAVLDEYRAVQQASEHDSSGRANSSQNYWEGLDTGVVAKAVAGVLPLGESWSSDATMFGEEEGDRIEVWSDDVDCAIDLRSFLVVRLQSIVQIARALDCKLVLHGSGEVLDPVLELVLQKIQSSRAYAFCVNPANFLRSSLKG